MTKRLCKAVNRLVSDIIIYWSRVMRPMATISLVPLRFANHLAMACRWIVGFVKILINDAMEPAEITSIEIYRLKLILK